MFGRYYPRYWKKKKRNNHKGLFGGKILSMEKVNALSEKIEKHEKKEQEKFDKAFEAELAKI